MGGRVGEEVVLEIQVYADVVCPWCYIGERRLWRALSARPEVEAEIRWRPFQLRPAVAGV